MHERQFALIMFVCMESHVLIVLYDTNDIVDTSDIVETVVQNEAQFFFFISRVKCPN